jgi:ribosomal protein L29
VKAQDYRNQSIQELEAQYRDEKRSLFDLVNTVRASKNAEKPHLINAKRKDIARLLTVLREKVSGK